MKFPPVALSFIFLETPNKQPQATNYLLLLDHFIQIHSSCSKFGFGNSNMATSSEATTPSRGLKPSAFQLDIVSYTKDIYHFIDQNFIDGVLIL
jgi:hypothetical protein